ncbi:hypothetical protein [Micromonospora cathayae]|uniref:Uncharacterized protein n=1 Tax=Micromonospora cathayae TaxID=3028804 RepID=A0ABY7ZJE8_9ACTN|nr:hypothetical protein [Micromonospora sp. HUAS 3]WDZ82223.1 hypothetical protein PVK37_17105 [Micromonospora sp. HUAS 3]
MPVSLLLATDAVRAADEVSWYDVPAVRIIGLVVGAVFLIAAIRAMFR